MLLTELFERREPNLRKTARTQRIMSQLRARYPQAETDLEALLYDFRAGQRMDRQDINRLDSEIDDEENRINQIQRDLDDVVRQRSMQETKKDPSPGKITPSEDPCWAGYHMVGTKKKSGRTVPNCVPGKKGS